MAKEPVQPEDKYTVRFPDGMRDRLKAEAEANNRSLNAEIIARLESSFSPQNEALMQATLVAESLRENLTARIQNYESLTQRLERREQRLRQREEAARDIEARAEVLAEEKLAELRELLEAKYAERMKMVEMKWQEAVEYAGFTIAREKQFVETIKALTGKEPPAVEPVPTHISRRKK